MSECPVRSVMYKEVVNRTHRLKLSKVQLIKRANHALACLWTDEQKLKIQTNALGISARLTTMPLIEASREVCKDEKEGRSPLYDTKPLHAENKNKYCTYRTNLIQKP